MKIFTKILLVVLPIAIIVNLFRYNSSNGEYEFFGVRSLVLYLQTFNGFELTMNTIQEVQSVINSFSYSGSIWETIAEIGNLLSLIVRVPFSVIRDLLTILTWFLGIFFNY